MKTLLCCITVSLFASLATAQESQNPLSRSAQGVYSFLSANVVKAAEKMPEESYAFKPTPEVRTFGQLVGHLADAQMMFCSAVSGEAAPTSSAEKSKTTKADLVQAVKDAVAYCNKVYDSMTDARGTEIVKVIGRDMPKLTVLSVNTAHDYEHYGNMSTYMRIRGIVPPSSTPGS
jgi:uncharacterized damage-inducible protein DinB